jgi:hypothetical protein
VCVSAGRVVYHLELGMAVWSGEAADPVEDLPGSTGVRAPNLRSTSIAG